MNERPEPDRSLLEENSSSALSALTIEVRRLVEGLQGGGHASAHMGASVEFAEHRKYCPGDDIRHIDWKALARTDRFFVKTHEREVTLSCRMLLDSSASMSYRGTRATMDKLLFAKILLGAMAHVLIRQGDAVGLSSFADGPTTFLPPDRRPEHLGVFLSALESVRAAKGGTTNFLSAIKNVAERTERREMIVLVSDLWDADEKVEIAIASLASRGHDVSVIHILSPDEIDLPFFGETTFEGLEDNHNEIVVNPALIRDHYRKSVTELRERWRTATSKAGVDLLNATTAVRPMTVLAEFAARRHRLVRRLR